MFPKALGLWDCRASATSGGARSGPGSPAPLKQTDLHRDFCWSAEAHQC